MKIFINCPRLTFKWITRTNTRENFFWNISNLVPHLVPHLRHLRHLCQKCLTLRHWGKCVPHLYHICGTCGTNINVPHFVVQWGLRTEDWGLRFVRDGNWGALRCMRCTSWEVIKLSSNCSSILYFHEIFKAKNCTTFCTTFVVLVVHISNVPHFVVHWGPFTRNPVYDIIIGSNVPHLCQKCLTLRHMECDLISSYLILLSFNFIMLN